jgi:RNA polymerase sigma-70 factor (ECF subfamily)
MRAWEAGDLDALAVLLHDDVVSSMPPVPGYFLGRDNLLAFIRTKIGAPGVRRLVRVPAADDLVIGFYRSDRGVPDFVATALHVVTLDGGLVRSIHAFLDPSLFAHFGLPAIHR